MFRLHKISSKLITATVLGLVLAACGSTQSTSPTPTPTGSGNAQLTLLQVPFTVQVPASELAKLRVAPVAGDWIKEMAPVAATQINYVGADGHANFLANAFWFDTARFEQLLDPNQPPPGTKMATVGDRTLVVAVTVEMPYATDSSDATEYGSLSQLLRNQSSYRKFTCPAIDQLPVQPVTQQLRDIVTAYFQGKDLLPATIDGDYAKVLDIQQQLAGDHACFNPGSTGEAGYSGAVPATAAEALMVYVHHKPYEVTGAESSFVTLARIGERWSIVSEGTGP